MLLQVIYSGDVCRGNLPQLSYMYFEVDLSQLLYYYTVQSSKSYLANSYFYSCRSKIIIPATTDDSF